MTVYVINFTTTCASMDDEFSATTQCYGIRKSMAEAQVAMLKCAEEVQNEAENWHEDPEDNERVRDTLEVFQMNDHKINIEYTNNQEDIINVDIEIFEVELEA